MANTSLGAQTLLEVIRLKKPEVIALLLKHGVVINPTTSDMGIAVQVTNLCKTSQSFYKAFTKLIADKNVVKTIYSNMSGYANAGGSFYTPTNFNIGLPSDSSSTSSAYCDNPDNKKSASYKTLCGSKDTTTSTTSSGGSKWLTEGLNLLQTGFNGYLQLDDNKTKRALADASVQVVQAGGSVNDNPPPKPNTALYVVLGIFGVSLVGLVVYLATKKKA